MPDNTPTKVKVPDGERISELWAAVKTLLAGKVDTSQLEDYPTIDAMATAITTALSSYPSDIEMQEAIADALSDYMTESEVNDAIVEAVKSTSGLHYELVDGNELPETGESNAIYLLSSGRDGDNVYDEWFYFNGKWELIGTTEVDVSKYWTKEELQIMTKEELEDILV